MSYFYMATKEVVYVDIEQISYVANSRLYEDNLIEEASSTSS